MNTRQQIAQVAARALRAADLSGTSGILGFDGFVDDIIHVVSERHSVDRYDRFEKMAAFAQLLSSTAGQGCNVELVVTRQKLGGNSPIMGNALATLGMPLTCTGALGDGPNVHAVFQDFAKRATLIPLCNAARTHALEFSDGKLMMGELAPLSEITWERLVEKIGLAKLIELFDRASFVGLLNWTMLPHVTSVWEAIGREILPKLSKKGRRVFVDLADPKKRRPEDLRAALGVLTTFNDRLPVTLGLNASEGQQVAGALGIPTANVPLVQLAGRIREVLGLDTVVLHPTEGAAAATPEGGAEFAGPYIKEPKILTGAGDHFNAGFALGQLLELPAVACLCMGTAVSGYYVRYAVSPTAEELAGFLEEFPEPQGR